MDLLTHAVVGAAGASALAPRRALRTAALIGAAGGLLPDSDQLIASTADPLLTLEFHRHFTHSALMVPVGALLIAGIAWFALRRREPFVRLYIYAFVGYLLSPLLDACTSYGTHLFWPFTSAPVALNIIAIVDPLFTLPILIAVGLAVARRCASIARGAILWGLVILSFGAVQHERALNEARTLAQSRGHHPQRQLVKPTLGNMLLWRSLYLHDEHIYVDAIRIGLGAPCIYSGESAKRFSAQQALGLPRDSVQQRDVERFIGFTDNLAVQHPTQPALVGDARYAMLPNRIEPLWGIIIDSSVPQSHARFENYRRLSPEVKQRFIDMLLGRPVCAGAR
jgi:inner membrane protein